VSVRDRIRIRKTAPQEWTVTRPRIGFSGPEITGHPTWSKAMRHIDDVLGAKRWGSTETGVERATWW
jgi:hypothetical protein